MGGVPICRITGSQDASRLQYSPTRIFGRAIRAQQSVLPHSDPAFVPGALILRPFRFDNSRQHELQPLGEQLAREFRDMRIATADGSITRILAGKSQKQIPWPCSRRCLQVEHGVTNRNLFPHERVKAGMSLSCERRKITAASTWGDPEEMLGRSSQAGQFSCASWRRLRPFPTLLPLPTDARGFNTFRIALFVIQSRPLQTGYRREARA